jgi:hexosaminidase
MRKLILSLAAVIGLSSAMFAATHVANYRVVPLPTEISAVKALGFNLNQSTKISYDKNDEVQARNAQLLQTYIKDLTGYELKLVTKTPKENAIVLSSNLSGDNSGAYNMTVSKQLITINGVTTEGTFHGIQTLRKSIGEVIPSTDNVVLPAVEINDAPQFSYRGMHLDVSRHFFPVDSVKVYIDMLALHNINKFHWHLTDDQGWRIEIKKYPELTEKGSIRKETMIEKNWDKFDNTPYGGFYTQDEVRDIIKYAADRHITIIPEIDLPGHMQGALHCYPNLGCTGGPYEVWTVWGVSHDVLCPGNDEVFTFLENVLSEIIDLFPSEYIHIGGDECPKDVWAKCPKCQARIKELNIQANDKHSAEEFLQSYVIKRVESCVNSKGRRIIGWDEILEGGVSPTATVMSWRGEAGGRAAAKLGNDVIMTPNFPFYFDHYQTKDNAKEPLAIGGCNTVKDVYSYNPYPKGISEEEFKHIKGIQANVWTEYMSTFDYVQYMTLPRMAAISEVQWCDFNNKDYYDFIGRLKRLVKLYDVYGYRYATHAL